MQLMRELEHGCVGIFILGRRLGWKFDVELEHPVTEAFLYTVRAPFLPETRHQHQRQHGKLPAL